MHLLPLTDAHFAWLLDEAPPPPVAPALPPGGVTEPEILVLLRDVATTMGGEIGGTAAWLMIVAGEAVGMVSIKGRDAAGRWDIAYVVAPARRRHGHAGAAVAGLKTVARARGAAGLTAETLAGGNESSRILARNGFALTGQFDHPEDGLVDQWALGFDQSDGPR